MTALVDAAQHGRRVWSLLEVLKLNATAFHKAVTIMARVMATVEMGDSVGANPREDKPSKDIREGLIEYLQDLESCLATIEARYTNKEVGRFLHQASKAGITYEELSKRFHDINARLYDELADRQVFVLASDKAAYYESGGPLFGNEVADKFQLAAYDIDEAGKCFALGRCTATVFHLMRVVEIGIRRLCDALDVTVSPNAGWQKILNDKLEPAINALPEATPAEKARKTDLQQARAHLHAIRLGWRNDTMHPKATYTEEEAKALIAHVETFMRHLATRLSASG